MDPFPSALPNPPATDRRRFLIRLAAWVGLLLTGRGALAARQTKPVNPAPAGPSSPSFFPAGDLRQVLRQALGGQTWEPSPDVLIQVPPLAENGAIVPVTVESRLPGTRRLLILAGNNPGPLLAEFRFEPGADPWVSLRLKLNASGPVLAIAEASGRFHGAEVPVKVMVGGCG